MNCTIGTVFCCAAFLAAVSLSTTTHAQTTPFTKTQIADRIRKVEDGVDQFRKYLESRGGDAKDRAESAQSSGATTRRQRSNSANTEARGNQAKQTKDDLEDAMDDLNRTTNRLRRKFDPTPNYLETKVQMEQVMDSGRRVNQVMVKGNYGTQAERYWAALRSNINDLAQSSPVSFCLSAVIPLNHHLIDAAPAVHDLLHLHLCLQIIRRRIELAPETVRGAIQIVHGVFEIVFCLLGLIPPSFCVR